MYGNRGGGVSQRKEEEKIVSLTRTIPYIHLLSTQNGDGRGKGRKGLSFLGKKETTVLTLHAGDSLSRKGGKHPRSVLRTVSPTAKKKAQSSSPRRARTLNPKGTLQIVKKGSYDRKGGGGGGKNFREEGEKQRQPAKGRASMLETHHPWKGKR